MLHSAIANARPQLTQATGHFTFDQEYEASGISPAASRSPPPRLPCTSGA
jgi:hypothetical protein